MGNPTIISVARNLVDLLREHQLLSVKMIQEAANMMQLILENDGRIAHVSVHANLYENMFFLNELTEITEPLRELNDSERSPLDLCEEVQHVALQLKGLN